MSTPPPDFQELTLAQVLRLALYHPGATLRRFFDEIALPNPSVGAHSSAPAPLIPTYQPNPDDEAETWQEVPAESLAIEAPLTPSAAVTEAEAIAAPMPATPLTTQAIHPMACGILVGLFFSMSLACVGGAILWSAATDPISAAANDTNGAAFWFWIALLLYGAVTVAMSWGWWRTRLGSPAPKTPPPIILEETDIPLPDAASLNSPIPANPPWLERFFSGIERHSLRMALIPVGFILAFLAYTQNQVLDPSGTLLVDVRFTRNGTIAWGLAILVWVLILGVDLNSWATQAYRRLTRSTPTAPPSRTHKTYWPLQWRQWRPRWQWLAIALILLLGVYFRFDDLQAVPPEMTSDHIEKLLDAKRVYDGYTAIFFRNNGGREAAHMYFIAALVRYGGLDFSFETLKIASGLEGMATVILSVWLGITVMGRETPDQRRMGLWLGLTCAALLAISSWHTMLSRLGLRISLTALTSMLTLIFLIRAMRYNRRGDFVALGLILGAGMYFYQANRMLPVLVVLGIGLAAVVYSRTWADLARYIINLSATVLLAVVIFLPMYRYQQEYPQDFWNRTRGRLFGEDAFVRTNPQTGQEERYEPNTGEQIERFADNFDVFVDNYQKALRMWSWRGDSAWINNGSAYPALDPYTNGLFLLGIAGWGLLILKKWDVGHLIIPVGILVMLLPSALTLAYTIENPSFTRASGTIPFVFLLAAYPLAQAGFYAEQVTKYRWAGIGLGVVLLLGVVTQAAPINYNTYFEVYRDSYSNSWKPYAAYAAPLRAFAQGDGSYGNAFMIAYPHWLDHRILGTVAGDITWNNGLVNKEDLDGFIQRNQGTLYQYDPSKPLFIMYNQLDITTELWLLERFPQGQMQTIPIPGRPQLDFKVYTIPPGIDWTATN